MVVVMSVKLALYMKTIRNNTLSKHKLQLILIF